MGGIFALVNNMKQEVDNMVKSKLESFISDMDFVSREEHEVLKAMVQSLYEENNQLKAALQKINNND